jgi:hypothetical protein
MPWSNQHRVTSTVSRALGQDVLTAVPGGVAQLFHGLKSGMVRMEKYAKMLTSPMKMWMFLRCSWLNGKNLVMFTKIMEIMGADEVLIC